MPVSLITAQELESLLAGKSSTVCLIDARTRADYNASHIPNAIYMGWEDWCAPAPDHVAPQLKQPGYWGEMCEIDQNIICPQFALLGIANGREIVVYGDGPKSKGREGRIAWMLLYLGASNIRILDGGISAWQDLGNPVDTKHPVVQPGNFHLEVQPQRRMVLAVLREMQENRKMPVMLDTRTLLEHIGDLHRHMPRRGRIPDSELIAYPTLFNADGTFVDKDQYLSILPPKAQGNDNLVVYCDVGPRACMVSLLHEMYTGQIVPVYEGSMMQWCSDPSLPVEKLSRES